MLDQLFEGYCQICDITREHWDQVVSGMSHQQLEKGQVFLRPDDSSDDFALILGGVSRHYYVGDDGKEWTKSFSGPGDLMGAYAEMLQGHCSRTFIEAITPMQILQGGKRELTLMQAPQWEKLWRRLAEDHFIKKENREYEFLKFDARMRYESYMKIYAHLDQYIPRKYVASYLGITPQALSRLNRES
jgi:CRP-like cAMP-binding protein